MNPSEVDERQLQEITTAIMAMAQLNFNVRPKMYGTGALDAVAAGLVALGEELENSVLARKQAEDANAAKSRFLTTVNHELRSPLTTIVANCEVLAQSPLKEEQRELLQQIQRASRGLRGLVDGLLDLSAIEAGNIQLESVPFRPGSWLKEVVAGFQVLAEQKGLELHVDCREVADVQVLGDRHRLEQVVRNLIDNAIKFTKKGRVAIIMRGQAKDGALALEIDVDDSGPGIAAHLQNQIFERFSESTGSASSGLGIGLSIARSLVQAMKGTLTLKSEPAHGSSFRIAIRLPLNPAPESASGPPVTADGLGLNILVVDDTEAIGKVTIQMLELLGCAAEHVHSGVQALERLREASYDLVLMDCRMPGMDGFETSARMHREGLVDAIPVVGITAYGQSLLQADVARAGMHGILPKPYDMDELQQAILQYAGPSCGKGARPR